jgi:lipid-binding SYLF domain-containing protein
MKKNILPLLLIIPMLFTSSILFASDKADAEKFVVESTNTLMNFANDPEMKWFHDHIKNAKGILIIPSLLKAGFIFGGSGGTGVMLRNNAINSVWTNELIKQWSTPAFYSMGSVTWGLQIGVEKAEVVLLVMTDKGMDAMLSTKFQLGADASIAAGPVGAGAKAATADVLQFSRAKGVFGGFTLEGSIINPREKLNGTYYGMAMSPLEILVKGTAQNAQANDLRAKLSTLSK